MHRAEIARTASVCYKHTPMTLVDSHCHLDHTRLATDQADVVERAQAAGVERIVNIVSGCGESEARRALTTAARYPGVFAAIGIHPHDAANSTPELLQALAALCGAPKLVAWGEIGLDYYYNRAPAEVQRQVFAAQLDLALEADLPVTLHVRDAALDLFELLRSRRAVHGDRLRGIWHCFTEGEREVEAAIELGLFISISGIVGYQHTETLRRAARLIPKDRLLIETDSPFLAPTRYRGRRNEPAFVVEVAQVLAEVRGESVEELAQQTSRNAARIYQLPDSI